MSTIDLGDKRNETIGQAPKESDKNKISYPSLYIDKEIPVDEKNIGKEMTAICKLKLRSIGKRSDNDGSKYSCSFDVMSINMNPKKPGHYQK